jgi:hypothetical protein
MRRVLLPAVAAGALLAAPAAASAVVVFTNFGLGDSFDTVGSPLELFGPTHASGVVQHWAATFTPGSDVFLDSVEVALEPC